MGQLALDRAFFVRVARRLVRDATDADDLVQDALVIAIRNGRVNGKADRAYVRGVLRNLALRTWRDRRRRRRRESHAAHADVLPDSTHAVSRRETRRALADDIESLPDVYRVPLMLRYFEELTPQEIALRLDVTPSTVRSRLQRARQRLRTRIDRRYGNGREALGACLIPLALEPMLPLAGEAAAVGASVAAAESTSTTMSVVRIATAVLLGVAAGSMIVDGTPIPFVGSDAPLTANVDGESLSADTSAHRTLADAHLETNTAGVATTTADGVAGDERSTTRDGAASATGRSSAPLAPSQILRGRVEGVSGDGVTTPFVAAFRMGAKGPEEMPLATTRADETGAFELRVPADETWVVVAAAAGQAPGAVTVTPTLDADGVRIVLAPGLTLEGTFGGSALAPETHVARVRSTDLGAHRLRLGEGQPELSWTGGDVHWREVTVVADADGRVTVPGLSAGRFVVDLVAQQPTASGAQRVVSSIELDVSAPTPATTEATQVPSAPDALVADAGEPKPPLRDVVGREVRPDGAAADGAPEKGAAPTKKTAEDERTHGTPPARPAWQPASWGEAVADLPHVLADVYRPRPTQRGGSSTDDESIETTADAPEFGVPAVPVPQVPATPEPVAPTENPIAETPVTPPAVPMLPPVPVIPVDDPPAADEPPPPPMVDVANMTELERRNLLASQNLAWIELLPVDAEAPNEPYHVARVLDDELLKSALTVEEQEDVAYFGEILPGQAPVVLPAGTYRIWCDSEIAEDPNAVIWLELHPGDMVMVATRAR